MSARLSFLALGLFVAGCDEAPPDDADALTPRGEASPTPGPNPGPNQSATVENACWAVGVITVECDPKNCPEQWVCPDVLDEGWLLQGKRMFVDGSKALEPLGVLEDDMPDALRRFCFYRADAPDRVLVEPKLAASVDCPVILPHGGTPKQDLRTALQRRFAVHVDAEAGSIGVGVDPVDLAVVDTHSDRAATMESGHASAMGRIAEAIACPNAGCTVEVLHALALPLESDGSTSDPEDGVYGTRGHLALGIVEAVTAFRERAAGSGGKRRLVLNLSLGWTTKDEDGCANSEASPWCDDHVGELYAALRRDPIGMVPNRYAVEAVHTALLYASCHGALVVAAAGNGRDDSCNMDVVAPGAWSEYRAPTREECEVLGFSPPESLEVVLPETADESWPLVLPVSAVDGDDVPITATRPGSITPLVAPGYFATFDPDDVPLTGTSVSSVAVSSAAALVWSQNVDVPAGEVYERLFDTGVSLPLTAERAMYQWPAGGDVRRLSVCNAQWVPGSGCVGPTALDDADTAVLDAAVALVASSPRIEYESEALLEPDSCNVCGADSAAWVSSAPDDDDAAWFFDNCKNTPSTFVFDTRQEIAGPQPNVPVCPDCPLEVDSGSGTARVTMRLDDAYLDGSVQFTGANVVMVNELGRRTVVDLPISTVMRDLIAGDVVTVRLPGTWSTSARGTFNAVLVDVATGEELVRGNQLLVVRR